MVGDVPLLTLRRNLTMADDVDEETVVTILTDLENFSGRQPSLLGSALREIATAMHSRRENVRRQAFSLVLRHLKQVSGLCMLKQQQTSACGEGL